AQPRGPLALAGARRGRAHRRHEGPARVGRRRALDLHGQPARRAEERGRSQPRRGHHRRRARGVPAQAGAGSGAREEARGADSPVHSLRREPAEERSVPVRALIALKAFTLLPVNVGPFFGELYLRSTRPFLPESVTRAEADYLTRAFAELEVEGPVVDI